MPQSGDTADDHIWKEALLDKLFTRAVVRLKLFEAEDFADEEVEVHGRADHLCFALG
jgi:hypothetical protein